MRGCRKTQRFNKEGRMILSEYPYNGNQRLIRTFSDDPEKAILQAETGHVYDEAIDVYPCRFKYIEVGKGDGEGALLE